MRRFVTRRRGKSFHVVHVVHVVQRFLGSHEGAGCKFQAWIGRFLDQFFSFFLEALRFQSGSLLAEFSIKHRLFFLYQFDCVSRSFSRHGREGRR